MVPSHCEKMALNHLTALLSTVGHVLLTWWASSHILCRPTCTGLFLLIILYPIIIPTPHLHCLYPLLPHLLTILRLKERRVFLAGWSARSSKVNILIIHPLIIISLLRLSYSQSFKTYLFKIGSLSALLIFSHWS